jgi:hypothetical protein
MSVEQFRHIPPEQQPVKQNPQIRLLFVSKIKIKVMGMYVVLLTILGKTFPTQCIFVTQ